MKSIVCHKCQHSWTYEPPLARKAECPQCTADAHVCLNCAFFDRNAHHECREEQAEWVKEKERSNFCSYFEPGLGERRSTERLAAQSKLDALFGGAKPSESKPGASLQDDLAKFLNSKKGPSSDG